MTLEAEKALLPVAPPAYAKMEKRYRTLRWVALGGAAALFFLVLLPQILEEVAESALVQALRDIQNHPNQRLVFQAEELPDKEEDEEQVEKGRFNRKKVSGMSPKTDQEWDRMLENIRSVVKTDHDPQEASSEAERVPKRDSREKTSQGIRERRRKLGKSRAAQSTDEWLPRPVRFDGQRLVRLINLPREKLDALLADYPELDVWQLRHGKGETLSVDVRVATPEMMQHIRRDIRKFIILKDNIQRDIDIETNRLRMTIASGAPVLLASKDRYDNWFSDYHRFDEIVQWYKHLAETYPHLVTFIPSIGKTVNGKDMVAVKITSSNGTLTEKPQLYFQGLQHAREWIGGSTVQYITWQLLTQYGEVDQVTSLLDRVEILIVPVMNPGIPL